MNITYDVNIVNTEIPKHRLLLRFGSDRGHLTVRLWELGCWNFKRMITSSHLSPGICHESCVMFHMSHKKIGEASRWRVCYQWSLPRLVFFLYYFVYRDCPNTKHYFPGHLNIKRFPSSRTFRSVSQSLDQIGRFHWTRIKLSRKYFQDISLYIIKWMVLKTTISQRQIYIGLIYKSAKMTHNTQGQEWTAKYAFYVFDFHQIGSTGPIQS